MKREKTPFNQSAFNKIKPSDQRVKLDDFILDQEIYDEIRDSWKPSVSYNMKGDERKNH